LYSPNNIRDPNQPKIYCGLRALPEGYDRMGDKTECLRKGYGTCLYANVAAEAPEFNFRSLWTNFWFWFLFICIIICLILLIIYLLETL